MKLSPNIAVITAMDTDHLDIYGDEKSMQDAFVSFGSKVRKDGLLITKFGLPRINETGVGRKVRYSLQNDAADVYASNIRIDLGGYVFDAHINGKVYHGLQLRIGGMHNVENVLVAITVADELKIEEEKIHAAVASFKGVKRRFEYIIPPSKKQEGAYVQPVLIDDYAHHPEELRALIKSVRSLFTQRKVTVIFQPHLFTRTRDLASGFSEVLSMADELILLPIYPARELPIEGVSSDMILQKMEHGNKKVLDKKELLEWMKERPLDKEFGEVIVMAGAGDIDLLLGDMKKILQSK